MKKRRKLFFSIAFCLVLMSLSRVSFAQAYLSGEVVVTNPEKVSASINYKFEGGTIGSFSFDGNELSLEFGDKVFNNVTTSIGFGFKPNGESCFYVSLEDGIEMGAIDVEGTGSFYGNSLKISYNPSIKLEYCVNWVLNTSFSVRPKMASYQKMAIKPKISVSFIPKLLLKRKVEIEPTIVLKNKNEEMVEAYCLEQDKKIPEKGSRFIYGDDSKLDESVFEYKELNDPFITQSLVYCYLDGYSIKEDDIIYMIKSEDASLFFFAQGYLIKYSNSGLESSVPLPLEYLNSLLNFEGRLQGKRNNRVYFNEKLDPEILQSMRFILSMAGFQNCDDGSMYCQDLNVGQAFDYFSNVYTPSLLEYYSIIIKALEDEGNE